uniref:Uncharacterized protein n=1 Tax=Steinernema glaseri TaxID=37863 RepID=A0A1I7Z5X7_9BILA
MTAEIEAKQKEQLANMQQQAKMKPIEPIVESSQEILLEKTQPPPQVIQELMNNASLPGRLISATQP